MDEKIKGKAIAAGIIALGAGRVASGLLLATGHGLAGAFFRKHHMMQAAMKFGSGSVEAGISIVKEGVEEWKQHS